MNKNINFFCYKIGEQESGTGPIGGLRGGTSGRGEEVEK
jgi:hypothetical protein